MGQGLVGGDQLDTASSGTRWQAPVPGASKSLCPGKGGFGLPNQVWLTRLVPHQQILGALSLMLGRRGVVRGFHCTTLTRADLVLR